MHPILRKLEGGDRPSIGRSNEVVEDVIADPALFNVVFFRSSIRGPTAANAADAVEKTSALHPDYLAPHRATLIDCVARLDQKEVRWHAAQMLSRVEWNETELQQVIDILTGYLNDRSSIVKTLADLAPQHSALRPAFMVHLQELTATGTLAMKARVASYSPGLAG